MYLAGIRFRPFLHTGNGVWELNGSLPDFDGQPDIPALGLIENHDHPYRLVSGTSLAEGEFAYGFDRNETEYRILFRPRGGTNPNLDGRHYRFCHRGTAFYEKAPRWRSDPHPDLSVSLVGRSRIADFCRAFRDGHPDLVYDPEDRSRTPVIVGISNSGSGSLLTSLDNAGSGAVFMDWRPERTLPLAQSLRLGAGQAPADCGPPCLYTHRWSAVGELFPDPGYLTLVREPYQRLISIYYYSFDRVGDAIPPFDRWLARMSDETGYGLSQLTWLWNLDRPMADSVTLPDFSFQAMTDRGMRITGEGVATARRSTEKNFRFVGLNDHFDESLFILSMILGLPAVGKWRMLNKSSAPRYADLPADAQRRIAALCEAECDLFSDLRTRFHDRFAEAITFCRTTVGSLRADT